MRARVSACARLGTSLGLAFLLLAGAPAAAAAPRLDSCERMAGASPGLKRDVDGLSWESMLEAMPALADPAVDEQAYLSALDEVHDRVRIDGSRMGIAAILWSICDLDGEQLRSRLATIRTDLDQTAQVLAMLAVPDRFAAVHRNYMQVVHLYQAGVAEMDRVADDGDAQHLRDAFPLTSTASDELARLEVLVWPPQAPNVEPPTGPGASAATGA